MMKLTGALLVLALGAGTAWSADVPTTKADRQLDLAMDKLQTGLERLESAGDMRTRSATKNKLDSALYHLRQARMVTTRCADDRCEALQEVVERHLVDALTAQAALHYERGSETLALKSLKEAAAIDPDDPRLCNLRAATIASRDKDVYDQNQGTTSIQRIRARREAAGLPYRDRGISLRR